MQTALGADTPIVFGALKIALTGGATIRLLDGAGSVSFNAGGGVETFTGSDPVFGVLSAIDEIADGVGDEAPGLSITLLPASDAAAVDLANPTMQGSPVTLWLGAVDRATGAVIADPLMIFYGELDQPTLVIDKGVRELEFECVSGFERMFENDEGARLADSFHQNVWPGETGLAQVTGITRTIYWGVEAPRATVVRGGGGGGGGGGRFTTPRDSR